MSGHVLLRALTAARRCGPRARFLAIGGVLAAGSLALAAAFGQSPGDSSSDSSSAPASAIASARSNSSSANSAISTDSAATPPTVIATPRSAPELVREALSAEVAGSGADRAALLAEAVGKDPDYAPARWHSGYVRMGKQWLSTDEVQKKYAADPRLAEYAQLRRQHSGTPEGELILARWCRANDLPEQARFHWLSLLRDLPNHEEALKALGMRWRNGVLATSEQAAQQKKEQFQASKRARTGPTETRSTWQTRIAKWEREGSAKGADLGLLIRSDLIDRLSDEAFGWITTILAERSRSPKASETLKKLNFAWIDFLKGHKSNARYLVAMAIWHPTETVRNAAADGLKEFPKDAYVPLLLACAKFPVEFSFAMTGVGATFTFDAKGYEGDIHAEHTDSFRLSTAEGVVSPPNVEVTPPPPGQQVNWFGTGFLKGTMQAQLRAQFYSNLMQAIGGWRNGARSQANRLGRQVDQYNAFAEEINHRVTDALVRATGVDLAADPRAYHQWWKDYWYDYYEIDQTATPDNERPVYTSYTESSSYYLPMEKSISMPAATVPEGGVRYLPRLLTVRDSLPGPRSWVCFHRSTPVWTLTGPVPIQSIRPGDRVLSQHPTTGELAYKTVLAVTTASPTPMIRITARGEDILSTRGHPFWVVGQQWRMAKQLDVGDRLHSPHGAMPIDDVRAVPLEETAGGYSYNLIVDDFHTYFVGRNKLLVHHLTMLSIVDGGAAEVPGLASR